jgi:hypothetical protein
MFTMPDAAQLSKYAKTLTPEQAFELYRANARIALDVIDAAIDSTAKMRKLQFEGEETHARSRRKRRATRPRPATFRPDGGGSKRHAGGGRALDGVLGADVRARRRDAEAPVHADGESDGWRAGVQQAKAAMAMMPISPRCRTSSRRCRRHVVGRLGVRIDAESDGRFRAALRRQALNGKPSPKKSALPRASPSRSGLPFKAVDRDHRRPHTSLRARSGMSIA